MWRHDRSILGLRRVYGCMGSARISRVARGHRLGVVTTGGSGHIHLLDLRVLRIHLRRRIVGERGLLRRVCHIGKLVVVSHGGRRGIDGLAIRRWGV